MNRKSCALGIAFAGLTLFFTSRANAQSVDLNKTWNFNGSPSTWWENGFATWFPGGRAGADTNGCCGFDGSAGDLWARNNVSGTWNSVNVGFGTLGGSWGLPDTSCDFSAEIRTDTNFAGMDGQMDVWVLNSNGSLGQLLFAQEVGQHNSYSPVTFTDIDVSAARSQSDAVLLVYGFHSNSQDHWMEVGNVQVLCVDCDNAPGTGCGSFL